MVGGRAFLTVYLHSDAIGGRVQRGRLLRLEADDPPAASKRSAWRVSSSEWCRRRDATVVHGSSKTRDGNSRRVLHIEYAATIDLGSGIELAIA
jgi:hypothetical protein